MFRVLGSSMLIIGVPIAIGSCLVAHREARDRGFVIAAMIVCAVGVLVSLAELFIPGGIIRQFWR